MGRVARAPDVSSGSVLHSWRCVRRAVSVRAGMPLWGVLIAVTVGFVGHDRLGAGEAERRCLSCQRCRAVVPQS